MIAALRHWLQKPAMAGSAERIRSNIGRLKQEVEGQADGLHAYPPVLYLEASDACNLLCPMCPLTLDMDRIKENEGHFKMELLEKLEAPIRNARRVFLSLGGEPMMGPDFFRIIRHVKNLSPSAEILFNTNGTFLTEVAVKQILREGVDHITFSMDGATKRTYERIRIGADFDEVTANIARLRDAKAAARNDRPRVTFQMTLMKQNEEEAAEMVRLAHRLGAAHLVIEPLTPVFNNYERYKRFYDRFSLPSSNVSARMNEARDLAAQLGIGFSSHYFKMASGAAPATRSCLQPWMTFIVKSNGEVRPCCGTDKVFGNLTDQSFEEIWNGPAYRDLRSRSATGNFPSICTNCLGESRTPSFNLDLMA